MNYTCYFFTAYMKEYYDNIGELNQKTIEVSCTINENQYDFVFVIQSSNYEGILKILGDSEILGESEIVEYPAMDTRNGWIPVTNDYFIGLSGFQEEKFRQSAFFSEKELNDYVTKDFIETLKEIKFEF